MLSIFEDVADLLISELRRRIIYPKGSEDPLAAKEKVHEAG